MEPVRLFVYGLLKKKYSLNYLLQEPQATFLGDRTTSPNYAIKDMGSAPIMVEGDLECEGELYLVKDEATLRRLDLIESGYNRTLIPLKDGEFAEAYIGKRPEYLKDIPSINRWEYRGRR